VEATLISGKGDLIITGQIGEVMQESARAALSYARSSMAAFGISQSALDSQDVHIHVPAGAIPKDGPSAGIAIATALISALTNKPVARDVAMTGEITLRGRVLPIGGLKEKALGALRSGITTIVIPEKNKKDLSEIPANVKRKIEFITVKDMSEVLPIAIKADLLKKKKAAAGKKKAGKTAAPKKSTAGKAPAKKPAAKKPAVKKPAAKKPAVKKPAAKKPAVKKPGAKKIGPRKK